MRELLVVAVLAVGLSSSVTEGAPVVFPVTLNGANNTDGLGNFGLGDVDGFATGNVTIDPSTNSVSWNISYNLLTVPLSDAHIHIGNFNQNGTVVVPFGPNNPTSGMLSGSTIDSDAAAIVANPGGYYVNIHTPDFPGGAIRGQVPEPSSLALIALPMILAMRRRAARG